MKRVASSSFLSLTTKKARNTIGLEELFDNIPYELVVEVLKSQPELAMFGPIWPNTLLSFGQASERNRQAVLESRQSTLNLTHWRSGMDNAHNLFEKMVSLFGEDLRELILVYPETAITGYIPVLEQLPQPPITSLRKASIAGTRKHLRLIRNNRSLTHLNLTLAKAHNPSWRALKKTFQCIPLTNLTLSVSPYFAPPMFDVQLHLGFACSSVKELTFDPRYKTNYMDFWGMILGMPRLERLSIYGMRFPKPYMTILVHLKELKINGRIPIHQCLPFHGPITELIQDRKSNRKEVSKLEVFTNLRSLGIALEDGAEIELQTRVTNLESLELVWRSGTGQLPFEFRDFDNMFYRADDQMIISIVRNARCLQKLALLNVILRTETLVEIIKIMGKRLKLLTIQIDRQTADPREIIAEVLFAFSRWGPNVQKLFLRGVESLPPLSEIRVHIWTLALHKVKVKGPNLYLKKVHQYLKQGSFIEMGRKYDSIFFRRIDA